MATSSRTKQQSRTASRQSSRSSGQENKRDENEAGRYRRAAEDALQQLDWTIGYLHGIKKTEISKALARNRSYIRRNLMHEPDAGLPVQQTDET